MDSSSVLACANSVLGGKQPAISTTYDDATYDESAEIQSMLDSHVSRWRQVRVDTPDLEALVGEMIDCHDEPVATATWLSHYLLCQSASREGFQSLFGGLGGDELNAGEYEYFTYYFADLRRAGAEAQLEHEVRSWVQQHDHPVFRKDREVVERNLTRLVDLNVAGRCLLDRERFARYQSALDPAFFDLEHFEPEMDHRFSSYLKNRTLQDLGRETIPCCLRAEDRQSTAFNLDHFLPFLDHRLVEFMFRTPGSLKIRHGVTKLLLRTAMAGLLPEATRTRIKKTGWNAPAHIWFAGKGAHLLRDLVASRKFRERGVYDVNRVRDLIDDHEAIVSSGKPLENHMMFLWQLLNLEIWLQRLDRQAEAHVGHMMERR
jgi:asparagine synthase (glutamine-hydrolysing)